MYVSLNASDIISIWVQNILGSGNGGGGGNNSATTLSNGSFLLVEKID